MQLFCYPLAKRTYCRCFMLPLDCFCFYLQVCQSNEFWKKKKKKKKKWPCVHIQIADPNLWKNAHISPDPADWIRKSLVARHLLLFHRRVFHNASFWEKVPSASYDDVISRLGHDKHWLQGLALFVGAWSWWWDQLSSLIRKLRLVNRVN